MSETQPKLTGVDYKTLLNDVLNSDRLPTRLEHQTHNVFTDLEAHLKHTQTDTTLTTIRDETETIIEQHIEHEDTDKTRYKNDTQNLNTFGAALLIALRRHEIPITSHEITDLINDNGDFTRILERFEGEVTADFTAAPDDNIKLTTPTREYQFRLVKEDGETPTNTTIKNILEGYDSNNTATISGLTGYISDNVIQHKHVTRAKREIDAANGEFTTPAGVERFVERYAAELGVHNDTTARAVTIAGMFPNNSGRDTSMTAAAALWMAAQEAGEPIQQSEVLNTADVTGPGLRNAIDAIDLDVEQVFVKTTTYVTPGGRLKVPDVIIDWTGIEGQYIEYPTALDGAAPGDRIALRVSDDIPDGDALCTPYEDTPIGDGCWCELDAIPVPDGDALETGVPERIRWDYDNDADGDGDVVYITVIDSNGGG